MTAALAPATANPRPTRLSIASALLGSVEVGDAELFHFPVGLFGLPDARSFVLLPADRDGLFWLQSTEEPALIFLLADPFVFFPEYAVELAPADRAELRLEEGDEVMVLAIVTLPRTRAERPTANLCGPLALSVRARTARQVALADPRFGVRAPFELHGG